MEGWEEDRQKKRVLVRFLEIKALIYSKSPVINEKIWLILPSLSLMSRESLKNYGWKYRWLQVSLKLMKAAETKHSGKTQVINIPAPKFHIFRNNSESVLTYLLKVIKIRPPKHIHEKKCFNSSEDRLKVQSLWHIPPNLWLKCYLNFWVLHRTVNNWTKEFTAMVKVSRTW